MTSDLGRLQKSLIELAGEIVIESTDGKQGIELVDATNAISIKWGEVLDKID